MTLDALVRLGLLLSISLIVLSLGARASAESALFVLRRPAKALRAVAAMFVAVPAFAILLAAVAPLPPAIRFAIVAMSTAPVSPTLPYKQMKAGGDENYAVGLLVAAALGSIVLTPLLIGVAAYLLGAEASATVGMVTRTLLISIGLPLVAGMLLHVVSKRAAQAIRNPAQRAGSLLLLVVFALMVGTSWREIIGLLGDGGALAIAATIAVGLLAGHLLGGRHSAALALAAASRHPGVVLAIAEISYPDQRKPLMAAVLLFLLITILVTAPYVRWVRGHAARFETPPAAAPKDLAG
jgi:BASS family bile acid:Na+ symporter